MPVEERVMELPAPRPGAVIIGRDRGTGQSVSPRSSHEKSSSFVIHVDDPLGQADGRLPRLRIAGEKLVKHQAGGVVCSLPWSPPGDRFGVPCFRARPC